MALETIGLGTELAVGDGEEPEVFTAIARLSEIGEITFGEADDVDITGYDTVGGNREYIRGLLEAGEVEFTGIFNHDVTQTDLINDLLAGPNQGNRNYKVTFPLIGTQTTPATWEASGYLKMFSINPQLDDRIEFSGSIKVSGQATFTEAT